MNVTLTEEERADGSMIGVSRPRIDSVPKLAGEARYGADVTVPGLLYARLVLSLEAHARIRGIDKEAAFAVPGVVAVLTAEDLPIAKPGGIRQSQPLAAEEVVFAGQPVAMVVAESEAAAEDGAEAVVVDYEPLPVVVDLEAAMQPDSPLARTSGATGGDAGAAMHADVGEGQGGDGDEERLSENVITKPRFHHGDVDAALAASEAVVSGRFRTAWVHQGYLEPNVALAYLEADGTLVVHASTQGTFYSRRQIANIYGLEQGRVRVVGTTLGGAFGAKLCLFEPLVAGAALALRRPVRLSLTRTEEFACGQPAPGGIVDIEVGGNATGLTAFRARVVLDAGGFSDWTFESNVAVLLGGAYRWEAWDSRAYGVHTNRFGGGAYRGPGGPQAAFIVESMIDELAAKLGVDPLELRHASAAREGDTKVDGGAWPRIGLAECLDAVREHPLWQQRGELPANEGVGLAAGVWVGATMGAAAVARLDGDGGLSILTGSVDMTGTATSLAAIAAETFGIPFERVRVSTGDTSIAPHAPPSGGSIVTYSVGRAVQKAAEEAREQLLRIAAEEIEIDPRDLEIAGGMVRVKGSPDKAVAIGKIASEVTGFAPKHPPVEGHGGNVPPGPSPSCAVHLAHVRVDEDTGEVRVVSYALAQDVGKAINPALCSGQLCGGAVQGIGWALYEQLLHDDTGNLLSGSFMSYAMPKAEHLPEIETILVEVPSPHGPFGAKGIAEACVLAAPGAVANGIAAASGARMREMPMTPPRVWRALSARSG